MIEGLGLYVIHVSLCVPTTTAIHAWYRAIDCRLVLVVFVVLRKRLTCVGRPDPLILR
jgi:hypothetical protein